MSGRAERCGPTVHGFDCALPKGHNRGQADVPENHARSSFEDELREAVDALWGWMPVEQVRQMERDEPELVELCKRVHHELWHETTHERRTMADSKTDPA